MPVILATLEADIRSVTRMVEQQSSKCQVLNANPSTAKDIFEMSIYC
jgi:hypothetical protein